MNEVVEQSQPMSSDENNVARRNDGSQISSAKAKEVWAAIESLLARGLRVNQRNIRTEMGGGSNSTINPVLREYRARLGEQPEDAELPIPGSLTSEFSHIARQLWNAALSEAQQQYSADRAELNERTQEMLESEILYEAEIQLAQTQIQGMQQQLDLLERDRLALETLTGTQAQDISTIRADLRNAAEKNEELSVLASKVQRDLQLATERIGELSAHLSEQKMRAETLVTENSTLKMELADVSTMRDELQRGTATLKSELEELSSQLTSTGDALLIAQKELAGVNEQLACERQSHLDAKAALDASSARTGELETTIEALRSALSRCNTDNAMLKEKHSEGLASIEMLKEQLKEAKSELAIQRQDNKDYRAENRSLRASISELMAPRGVDGEAAANSQPD